jgi:CRISPR/Cas system-associated exonuclease Cas4 (RecB family)
VSDCTFADVQQFASALQSNQRELRRARHSRVWHPTMTPASMLGYRCDRRLVYQRVDPKAARLPDEELSGIFEEGNYHEAQVKRELSELGYEVLDANSEFVDERLDLKGHVDGRLRVITNHSDRGVRIPLEIKSTQEDGPRTQEDWRARTGLFARYYAQLQSYMFLTSSPFGLGLFKSKITGLWTVCPVELDYAYAEELLKRAERVRDAVRLKVLPDRLLDRSECRGCPFEMTCLPGDAPVDPLLIAEDDTLINDLRTREQMRATAKTHDAIDKRLKERFKLTKGDRFVAGEFLITKRTTKTGAVYVETEVAPGAQVQPPAEPNLEDALRRSLA